MAEVICVGIAGVDVLIAGADLTAGFSGETMTASSVELVLGGDAANEAMVLTRLGKHVALMSGVGEDGAGRLIRAQLEAAGVDQSLLRPLPAGRSSALNVVLVHPDGQRNFINTGAPAEGWVPDTSPFGGAKIVSLASFGLPPFHDPKVCLETARAAKEAGCTVCADVVCTGEGLLERIAPALRYVDYFFPNEEEAAFLTGEATLEGMTRVLLETGIGHLVLKTGAKGCRFADGRRTVDVPGVFCKNVVDTTGAGDNFLAGFLCALLDGKQEIECCTYAHAVAAVSIQSRGACTGVRGREQVEETLRRTK